MNNQPPPPPRPHPSQDPARPSIQFDSYPGRWRYVWLGGLLFITVFFASLLYLVFFTERHYEYRCVDPGIVEQRRVGPIETTEWAPTGVPCND